VEVGVKRSKAGVREARDDENNLVLSMEVQMHTKGQMGKS
jgi:hypothetical protein